MELLPVNAYLITEKYGVSRVKTKNDKDFTLYEVRRYADGYIEAVRLTDERIMIVNEMGKFTKGLQSDRDRDSPSSQSHQPAKRGNLPIKNASVKSSLSRQFRTHSTITQVVRWHYAPF